MDIIQNTEDLSLSSDLLELAEIAKRWYEMKPDNPEVKRLVKLAKDINLRMIKIQIDKSDLRTALENQRKEKLIAREHYNKVLKVERDANKILKEGEYGI